MFYREIEDFEQKFKLLDRLNIALFNCWRDTQADKYRDSRAQILEALYRNYISEMRELSNELSMLEQQINEQRNEINSLQKEITKLQQEPEIDGCWICTAKGCNGNQERFIVGSDENLSNLEEYAEERTNIHHIEEAHTSVRL